MAAELQVVSQEMSGDMLVARQHLEDLTTHSQLIVYESQEAIFVKNGQALDQFGAGRHDLKTAGVPLIKKFFSGLFGGKTPFPCDIYFVKKVNVLDFVWGTDSPIELSDPGCAMIVGVRANGQTGFRIADARRFVIKVVGMVNDYSTETLKRTVKALIMGPIKECIAQTILEKQVSVLDVMTRLTEISATIQEKLNARIADLGVAMEHFNVYSISTSEGDLAALKKAREDMVAGRSAADVEAYKMTVLSEARAKAREIEGYTYEEQRRFDILEGAAKNEGAAGGLINMGVGLGVGAGVGGAVGKMVGDITAPDAPTAEGGAAPCPTCGAAMPAGAKFCMNCGTARPVAKFCPECGTKAEAGAKFCMNCGTKLG